ncbi:MAG: EamA family transporter [Neisseriaceae bacterium]
MQKKDLLLAVLVAAIWGTNYSVIEIGLSELDPFLLTALRFILCAVPLCFFIKKPEIKLRFVALYGFVFGVCLWGVANTSMFVGLPAGIASLLLQFSALFTIMLSSIFLKEKIQFIQYIGMGIAIFGLVLVLYFTSNEYPIKGVVLIIISAFSWSICNIIIKIGKPFRMLSFIIWSSLFSAFPLLIIAYIIEGNTIFINLSYSIKGRAVFSLFFQVYVTTIFGYWVWNKLMKKYTASTIAPVSLLIPVFGLITSHFISNEVISFSKIISSSLIIFGMFILIYGVKIKEKFLNNHVAKANVYNPNDNKK